MNFPLNHLDRHSTAFGLIPVTMVFSMVEGGKAYVAKHRTDAKRVNAELVAVMRNALRQVLERGG